ncbi:MAG: hypothetical protein WC066_03600, partial [Candidatus Omnitrophota bacterium]
EAKANDLKSAVKDKNVDRIKKGMEDLSKASHKLAEEIYKQAAAKKQQDQKEQAAPGGPGEEAGGPSEEKDAGAKKDEDIIDAEYKEEDQGGKK